MCFSAMNDHLNRVVAGPNRAGVVAQFPRLQCRHDVQTENRFDLRIIQDSLVQHQIGTTGFPCRGTLLGRLENELH